MSEDIRELLSKAENRIEEIEINVARLLDSNTWVFGASLGNDGRRAKILAIILGGNK